MYETIINISKDHEFVLKSMFVTMPMYSQEKWQYVANIHISIMHTEFLQYIFGPIQLYTK